MREIKNALAYWSLTGTIAKIRKLIHIKPYSIELYILIENSEHIWPILRRIRMEEINKSCFTWPYLSNEILAQCIFNKYISF